MLFRDYDSEVPALPVRFTIPAPDKALFSEAIASPFSAISHDGRTVPYLAISDGVHRIWIRPLNSSEASVGDESVTFLRYNAGLPLHHRASVQLCRDF